MAKQPEKDFTEKEAQARFEAALRGGMNAPHKALKKKKVKKAKSRKSKK